MNYKKTETVGELTTVTEYEGTPQEIYEVLKYEHLIKNFSPEPLKSLIGENGEVGYIDNFQGHKLRDTKISIDGSAVAKKVREALDEQYKKLQDIYTTGI